MAIVRDLSILTTAELGGGQRNEHNVPNSTPKLSKGGCWSCKVGVCMCAARRATIALCAIVAPLSRLKLGGIYTVGKS